jgi:hypothetical protein
MLKVSMQSKAVGGSSEGCGWQHDHYINFNEMNTNLSNVICSVLRVMSFIHLQHLYYVLCLVSSTWLQILERMNTYYMILQFLNTYINITTQSIHEIFLFV